MNIYIYISLCPRIPAALGTPRAYQRVSRPERPYAIQEYGGACGIGISVKYDVTATGRCTQPSVPLPLLSRGSLLLSAYRDFSQANSLCAFSTRGCSYHVPSGAREAASAEQDWRCGRINKTLTMRARTSACGRIARGTLSKKRRRPL